MNGFEAAADMLEGAFAPHPEAAEPGQRTLFQAMREAFGLVPEGGLCAYRDWRTTTAPYTTAVRLLQEQVNRRHGAPIEPNVWSGQEDRSQSEVVTLLRDLAAEHPNVRVPDPPPELRPHCDPSTKPSLKLRGVVVGALSALHAVSEEPLNEIVAALAHDSDLADMSDEALLDAIDGHPKFNPESSATSETVEAIAKAWDGDLRLYRFTRALAAVFESAEGALSDSEVAERAGLVSQKFGVTTPSVEA